MIASLSLANIALETGGELTGDVDFNGVSTDTRNLQSGDLYVALKGEHFDGDRFVDVAADAGAGAAVVGRMADVKIPQLQVEDTRMALGLIARCNRRQFPGPLIALTGSAGKTTTKEMLASILDELGKVIATSGNFNNEIGVPKTLLRIDKGDEYAVIEMGASHQGDIAYLCQFAEPDVAVLTNAMAAHIEGFGDIETVATTKGEIFESLADGGTAVINRDDRFFAQWQQQAAHASTLTFSLDRPDADFFASHIAIKHSGVTTFKLHSSEQVVDINLPLLGKHNIANALAACAAAVAVGASLAQVKAGLEKVKPVKGRLMPLRCGTQTVIDDSYNASPGSVCAAIDVLAGFTGSRCLVLGTMAELGELAEQGHKDVAEYAQCQGIEQLVAVGEYAQLMAEGFGDNGFAYEQQQQLIGNIEKVAHADVVLIKGSRSARMERVVESLLAANERKQ